jgi:hypothetical protein
VAKAAEDRQRFERERAEYLIKNPPRPKNPRNPYNVYCQELPHKNTRPPWKSLSAEQKLPFEEKAKLDKGRFAEEMAAFQRHCEETGKDFEALTARKKRKRTATPAADKPKKARKPRAKSKTPPKKKARKPKKAPEPVVEDDVSDIESDEVSDESDDDVDMTD